MLINHSVVFANHIQNDIHLGHLTLHGEVSSSLTTINANGVSFLNQLSWATN